MNHRALKIIAMISPPKAIKWQEEVFLSRSQNSAYRTANPIKPVLRTICRYLPLWERCIDNSHSTCRIIYCRYILQYMRGNESYWVSATWTLDVAEVKHILHSLYYEENYQPPAGIGNSDNQIWTHILDCNCGLIFTTVKSIVLNSITMR